MSKSARGFTLVELLVTISIISILSAVGLVVYSSVIKQGRDAKRQSDLRSIQSALEMYYADKGEYPCGAATGTCKGTSGAFGWGGDGQGWATNNNGSNGLTGSCTYPATLENILKNNKYLNEVPHDPYGGCDAPNDGKKYGYMYYAKTIRGTDYCLYARLENPPADNGCSGCPDNILTSYDKNFCVQNP